MPTPNLTSAQLLTRDAPEVHLPRVASSLLFRERWWVNTADYSRGTIGAAHGTASGYYLVDEQPYRATEDHTFFERTYAKIPSSHEEPVSFGYTFPGWLTSTPTLLRTPVTWTVLARVVHDYFQDDNPTPLTITGATGTASTDVIAASGHPFIDGDRVTFIDGTGFDGLNALQTYFARDVVAGTSFKLAATKGGSAEDFTVDGSAGIFRRGIPQIDRQRYYVTSDNSEQGYVTTSTTTPSLATYQGWVNNGEEIVAEDSTVELYMGNIWVRKTPYLIAR